MSSIYDHLDRMETKRHFDFFSKEVDRHRAKILEINAFMEMMKEALANIPQELDQEIPAE